MSASLIDRHRAYFYGTTIIRHRYSNGDEWIIIRNELMIHARLVRPHGREHHFKRER